MKELIEKLERVKKNTKQFNGISVYYKVGDVLMDEIIQSLTQEPSAVSAEEVFDKLITNDLYSCSRVWEAWSIGTMSQEDFVPLNQCEEFKDSFIQAMQEYANASMREHAIGFAKWIGRNGFYRNASETNLLWVTNDNMHYLGYLYTNEGLYTEYLKTLTTK